MANTLLFVGFAVKREKNKNGRVETGEGTIIGTRAPSNEQDPRKVAGDAASCVMDDKTRRPGPSR